MTREINIDVLDHRSIDDAIKNLEEYMIWLDDKTAEFLERLAIEAIEILEAKISRLETDAGKIVVPVHFEWRGDGSVDVIAEGSQILFLEFGTGTQTYPDTHPDKPGNIVGRGEYGKGHGKWKTWAFYSDETPGRYGWKPKGTEGIIATHGVPAQMPMLETVEAIQRKAAEIAREVFGA